MELEKWRSGGKRIVFNVLLFFINSRIHLYINSKPILQILKKRALNFFYYGINK